MLKKTFDTGFTTYLLLFLVIALCRRVDCQLRLIIQPLLLERLDLIEDIFALLLVIFSLIRDFVCTTGIKKKSYFNEI